MKKNILYYFACFLLGIILTYTLFYDVIAIKLYNVELLIISMAFAYIYIKCYQNIKFRMSSFITSVILAIFYVIGKEIDLNYKLIIFNSFENLFYDCLSIFSITSILYIFIDYVYKIFDNYKFKEAKNKVYKFIFEKHPILMPFIILMLCYLPYIIIYYPGTVQWDGMKQLDYFFGIVPWSNHHPAFSTMLMGVCVNLGRHLVNDNFGLFIYNFIQVILSCLIFSLLIKTMTKLKANRYFILITFLIFALLPIWPINSYTLVKDTSYYLVFIVYLITIIKYYDNPNLQTKFSINLGILILSILLLLLRNNGFYVVLLSTFMLLFINNNKIRLVYNTVIVFIIIGFYGILNICILPYFHIGNTAVREALSVPMQQTARYVYLYENKLTKKEKKVLKEAFDCRISKIKKAYNPEISDPVKALFKANIKPNELHDYFGIWKEMLLKHPGVYVDAFLDNYYGYIFPDRIEYKDGIAWFYIEGNKNLNNGYFKFHMNKNYKLARDFIEDFAYNIREVPVLGLLYNVGFYNWILIVGSIYLIKNKRGKDLIVFMPLYGTLLFCFLSPVDAYIRYELPIMVTIPIFISYLTAKNQKDTK